MASRQLEGDWILVLPRDVTGELFDLARELRARDRSCQPVAERVSARALFSTQRARPGAVAGVAPVRLAKFVQL
jgi:hypothetical protein